MLLSILLGSAIVVSITVVSYMVETSDRRFGQIEEQRMTSEWKYYNYLG